MLSGPSYDVQIYNWIGQTPWILVACVGLVLCMVFAGRQLRRCLLIAGALLIKLALYTVAPYITPLLLDVGNVMELKWRILTNGLLYSVPEALALGLLLWAAFTPAHVSASSDARNQ